jgi:hypothetical protein
MTELVLLAAGAVADTEAFLACETGVFGVVIGAALGVTVDGRGAAGLTEEASDARGARTVDGSALERVLVAGRFAVVVLEGAIVDLRSETAGFPGEDRVADDARVVLRTEGFLFSSPDVMDDRSGSASEAAVDLVASPGRLATVPGAGRVGGLFKLDPVVLVRIVELARGFDAVVEARGAVVLDEGGRRAPTVAVPPVVGRRGGTFSFVGADILSRVVEVSVDAAVGLSVGASAGAGATALELAMLLLEICS